TAGVQITRVLTPTTDDTFRVISKTLGAQQISNDSVQIVLGAEQPELPIQITMTATEPYISGTSDHVIGVIAATENESEGEGAFPTVVVVNVSVDRANARVSFGAEPILFVQKNSLGQHFGLFTLALVPGTN